jgi:hypothetical protein
MRHELGITALCMDVDENRPPNHDIAAQVSGVLNIIFTCSLVKTIFLTLPSLHSTITKVAVVRDSHKLFLSLTGEFE